MCYVNQARALPTFRAFLLHCARVCYVNLTLDRNSNPKDRAFSHKCSGKGPIAILAYISLLRMATSIKGQFQNNQSSPYPAKGRRAMASCHLRYSLRDICQMLQDTTPGFQTTATWQEVYWHLESYFHSLTCWGGAKVGHVQKPSAVWVDSYCFVRLWR